MRAAGLICLAVALPAFAAPTKAVKPPADLPALLTMVHHFLEVERELAGDHTSATPLKPPVVLGHLEQLHALALGFDKLERRGELRHLGEGKRTVVRHALAELLGQSIEFSSEHMGDALQPVLEQRDRDLALLREVAQKAFDFDLPSS
jgi:hypothetical protein